MARTITVRFVNGKPVSTAKDPRTRRTAEAFGAAFLKAAQEGRDTLNVVAPNPDLPEDAQTMAAELLAGLPTDFEAKDMRRLRVSENKASLVRAASASEKRGGGQ